MRINNLRLIYWCWLLVAAIGLLACDRAPKGVIGESKMTNLQIDLLLAESYIENHPNEFPDDSTRQTLKQSIFKKHHVSQALYDSSLVWYAHNMEVYTKVYDNALSKLEQQRDKMATKSVDNPTEIAGRITNQKPNKAVTNRPIIPTHRGNRMADSTDIWIGERTYRLTQGMGSGFITFDLPIDDSYQKGDRYQFVCKLTRASCNFKTSVMLDYSNGTTSQVSRPLGSEGWTTIDIQSDTALTPIRIYGYISYNIPHGHIAGVDSLMLLRSRYSPTNYNTIHAQRELIPSK